LKKKYGTYPLAKAAGDFSKKYGQKGSFLRYIALFAGKIFRTNKGGT
jgi:hypothetical protein